MGMGTGLFGGNPNANTGTSGRGRGRPKKDPFAALDEDFKDKAAGASIEQLNEMIATVAANEAENLRNKTNDIHLAEMKEAYDEAGAGYKEATTMNKLRTAFLLRVRSDKGGGGQ